MSDGNPPNSPASQNRLGGEEDVLSRLLFRLNVTTDPKPPKLQPLKVITRSSLQEFLVRFERARKRASYDLDILEWMSGPVQYQLKARGVQMDGEGPRCYS